MWVPERVWEQSFTRDLVDAGIEYTILDDFHFKMAGLTDSQIRPATCSPRTRAGVLSVFPGSERLRYLIPFGSPEQTIDYLAKLAGAASRRGVSSSATTARSSAPGRKRRSTSTRTAGWCGSSTPWWPTRSWIQVTTPAEAIDNVPPLGKVYLPDCSYREMTEWALPTEQLVEYERIAHEMQDEPRWSAVAAVRARRLLAELQGEVSRSRRDVLPHDDGQPPLAGGDRRRGAPARWSSRPARSSTAASATAATGTGPSAASTCRTSATPSTAA